MRIGIDGSPLVTAFHTGTRHYAENILVALSLIDKRNEYFIYSPGVVNIPKQKNFHLVLIPSIPVFKKQLLLPLIVKKSNLDIFHYLQPFGSIFLSHPKIITTVHDLDLNNTYPYLSRHFLNRIYCEITRYALIKRTKYFITDTLTIKNDLSKHLKNNKIKAKVGFAYLSFNKIFRRIKVKKGHKKFFICMGDFARRKNIRRIVNAYLLLPKKIKEEYSLTIISSTSESAKKFEKIVSLNKASNYINIVTKLPSKKLVKIFNKASAFIYTSIYEGFGLPILEAMASGCPVITSDYGAMKEVAGGAAMLVNPLSEHDIMKSMVKTVKNENLRVRLIKKGFIRVREFSWRKTATETLAVYKKVAESK